jgi:hypothetical protein
VCLAGEDNQVIACSDTDAAKKKPGEDYTARVAEDALTQLFSPRVDLSQMEINSLDGQNVQSRDALKSLFE